MMKIFVKQRGLSFGGFIIWAVVLVFASIFSMKLIPVYIDNGKIQKALNVIVSDPAMQEASIREVKDSFVKRAITMDSVTAVTTDDLVITKENGKLSISASYNKTVPLVGNVSLLLEFNPSAPK